MLLQTVIGKHEIWAILTWLTTIMAVNEIDI